ncbi:MAG: hypothetical protein PHP35_00750 [Candidatus Colwellbacteria bacterium]|nr:hypothetical protein [Candidatus Colwellbacteria bacterium]
MEKEKPKKKKIDKSTAILVILSLLLGIGIGRLTSQAGDRAVIKIEKRSESSTQQ